MMCHALIHCRTLGKALQRGLLFYSLFPDAPSLTLEAEGERVRLVLDDSTLWDPDHFLTESLLVVWHRLASWLIGQRIGLEQATFGYPKPTHGAEYDLLFPCPLVFEARSSSLLFHSRYLDMPLLQDERTLKHFLERSPADLLSRPDDGHSLSSQLRRLLCRDAARWPDLDTVAGHLHISPQTLRRHLREEGTSFQELKDQLRRDIAIYHLGRADLSLQQIAEQLGFSEPSAFHRAFKKWTGGHAGGLSGVGELNGCAVLTGLIASKLACMFRLEGVGGTKKLDSDSSQYGPWETSRPALSTQSANKEFIGKPTIETSQRKGRPRQAPKP
nr:hypothetical protein GCM10020185_55020 [Pseudomonas brassicacearum subsp. brassicacearum]